MSGRPLIVLSCIVTNSSVHHVKISKPAWDATALACIEDSITTILSHYCAIKISYADLVGNRSEGADRH